MATRKRQQVERLKELINEGACDLCGRSPPREGHEQLIEQLVPWPEGARVPVLPACRCGSPEPTLFVIERIVTKRPGQAAEDEDVGIDDVDRFMPPEPPAALA
jgi:hypothetical protein